MKPSERIYQIMETREKNIGLKGLEGEIDAIIIYLDELHRFEHPDWDAECARIVREIPDVIALKAWIGTHTTGCPEEGIPFEDEPALFVRAIIDDAYRYQRKREDEKKTHEERNELRWKIERDLSRFASPGRIHYEDRALSDQREYLQELALAELGSVWLADNYRLKEWPALEEVPA